MNIYPYQTLIPLLTELHGPRVTVRPYRESDAQDLHEAIAESRDFLRPWMPFADEHRTLDATRDWIIHQTAQWSLRENMSLGIWERTPTRFVGGSGFMLPRNWAIRSFEIGYWLRASASGQGYMTEAVKLLVDYLFTELAAQRVEIRCDKNNLRSAAIPRRLGFVQEGCLRNEQLTPSGALRDTLVFSLIPEDRVKQALLPNS